jgi:hypothetical protein
VPIVLKSGSLNLLEPSGPAKACNGIALPLLGDGKLGHTLRKERRLKVFENRVLMKIFGHKWDEVKGEWRKIRNEELSDL